MASYKTTAYTTLLVLVFANKQWYIYLTITIKKWIDWIYSQPLTVKGAHTCRLHVHLPVLSPEGTFLIRASVPGGQFLGGARGHKETHPTLPVSPLHVHHPVQALSANFSQGIYIWSSWKHTDAFSISQNKHARDIRIQWSVADCHDILSTFKKITTAAAATEKKNKRKNRKGKRANMRALCLDLFSPPS